MKELANKIFCSENTQTFFIICALFLTLTACGGGGDDSVNNDAPNKEETVLTGVFVDAVVSGLAYSTTTQSGVTSASGQFSYVAGETVTFSVGGILLGAAPGASLITPFDLVPGVSDINDPRLMNIIRLLLSLDDDGDPDNGIAISEAYQFAAASIASDVQVLTNDTELQNLLDSITGSGIVLIDPAPAETHLIETMVGLGIPVPGNFVVSGNITGSTGTVVLQNNAGDNLNVSGNISFTFADLLPDQSPYSVTVHTPPAGQTCSVTNGSGVVSGRNISDVIVSCVDVVLPPAPQNLQTQPGDSEITLSWNSVGVTATYNVYMASVSGVTPDNYVSLTNGDKREAVTSPLSITLLTNETRYYFIVTSIVNGVESAPSTETSAMPTIPQTNPNIPVNVVAVDGEGQISVTWDSIAGTNSYNIYTAYHSSVSPGSYLAKYTSTTNAITLTSLENALTYYIVVTSIDEVLAESNPSTAVHATPYTRPIGSWVGQRQPAMVPRENYSSAMLNEKIYIFGGAKRRSESTVETGIDIVEQYDIATNLWKRKGPLPNVLSTTVAASAAVAHQNIYVIGERRTGYSGQSQNTLFQYVVNSDEWVERTPLPIIRREIHSVTYENKIYTFGLGNTSGGESSARYGVDVYDPLTDSWINKGESPENVGRDGFVVIRDKIYIVGGNSLIEYDPTMETWTEKTPMNSWRGGFTAVAYGGRIYTFGGYISDPYGSGYPINSNIVEVYDPTNDTWQALTSTPSWVDGSSAHVVDDRILILSRKYSTGIYEYIVAEDRWTTTKLVFPVWRQGSSERNAPVINNIAYTAIGTTDTGILKIAAIDMDTYSEVDIAQPTIDACASVAVDGKLYVTDGWALYKDINSSIEVYDPVMDAWTLGTPSQRHLLCYSAAIGVDIYVVTALDNMIKYNTRTGIWSYVTSAPINNRQNFTMESFDGKIYLIGGEKIVGNGDREISDVHVFDPLTNVWSLASGLKNARHGLMSGIINNKIYVWGGQHWNYFAIGTVEAYDPALDRWSIISEMPTSRFGAISATYNNKFYSFGGYIDILCSNCGEDLLEIYDPLN